MFDLNVPWKDPSEDNMINATGYFMSLTEEQAKNFLIIFEMPYEPRSQ
jgi:hypothetical protein